MSKASISPYPFDDIPAEFLGFQQRLNQADAAVRRITIMDIADEEDSDLLPLLHHALLYDNAVEVRREAAIRLEGWEDEQTILSLSKALLDSEADVKHAASQSLSELKQADSAEPLLPLLQHDDHYVRAAALRAIRELRPLAALDVVIENTWHSNVLVRREAVSTLGWLKQQSAQALLAQLASNDPDAEVRRIATGALGISTESSLEIAQALLSALKDNVWQIRVEAALTIGKVKIEAAVQPLIDALEDSYWQVRIPAARALGKLKVVAAVDALAEPLQHEISNLRKEAALALGEIGGPQALQLLQQAEQDSDPEVRKAVRIALRQIQQVG